MADGTSGSASVPTLPGNADAAAASQGNAPPGTPTPNLQTNVSGVVGASTAWTTMGQRLEQVAERAQQLSAQLGSAWSGSAAEAAQHTLKNVRACAESGSQAFLSTGQAIELHSGHLDVMMQYFEPAKEQVTQKLVNSAKVNTPALVKLTDGPLVAKTLNSAASSLTGLFK
jgi:hypothetical protein